MNCVREACIIKPSTSLAPLEGMQLNLIWPDPMIVRQIPTNILASSSSLDFVHGRIAEVMKSIYFSNLVGISLDMFS